MKPPHGARLCQQCARRGALTDRLIRAIGSGRLLMMMRHFAGVLLFWLTIIGPATAADFVGIPRIVDGDTVQIDSAKIRLQGIDAPETDQICLDASRKR